MTKLLITLLTAIVFALPASAQSVADGTGTGSPDPECQDLDYSQSRASWESGVDFSTGSVKLCLPFLNADGLEVPMDGSVTYLCDFKIDGRLFARIPAGNPGTYWVVRADSSVVDPDGTREFSFTCGWTLTPDTATITVPAIVPTTAVPEVPHKR